ncbi:TCP-1/cpn60 chaperonin family protein [anaerobic digester metagenome]
MLVALRASHEKGGKNAKYMGLDVFNAVSGDMLKAGVVEPLRVKTQAVSSAAEAAIMILRIDDVIAASKSAAPAGGPGMDEMGGMGGMGGMGMPPM